MSAIVSKCCHYSVRVGGHTTRYYVCNMCDRACDVDENYADSSEEGR